VMVWLGAVRRELPADSVMVLLLEWPPQISAAGPGRAGASWPGGAWLEGTVAGAVTGSWAMSGMVTGAAVIFGG
jgi:hypothetical protein